MGFFDALRGFSALSMIGFHLCYDLRFIAGLSLGWFAPPLQDLWRASISWTFLFVAGCMCAWSRDNLRRAGRYLCVAMAIFAVTSLAAVDVPISFGIIYCMGASTLVAWLLDRLGIAPTGPLAGSLLFLAFIICLPLSGGHVGWGVLRVDLPRGLYATPWLSWLGFPGPGFASGDYYPPLPFTLMYLVGVAMGRTWRQEGLPSPLRRVSLPALERVGRHALELYVLHQPILLLVTLPLSRLA